MYNPESKNNDLEENSQCNELRRQLEDARQLIQKQALEIESTKNKVADAEKAKGQFLANISHEIRTPLNGVLGMTELLLDTDLSDDQLNLAENIQTSATHLLHTIEDILQFSRVEAKKAELNLTMGPLDAFLEEIPLVFSRLIQENEIVFVEVFDSLIHKLNFDQSKLRQVLVNILGNAFKFTGKGGAIVHQARVEAETENEVKIKFIVTDTGPGIADSEIKKIFQPFYQVDNSSTRSYGGTGLGLAISHELVSLMGGELQVNSRLNCGACFYFVLTIQKAIEELEPVESQARDNSVPIDKKDLRPLNILIAEDMKVNQQIIALQLEKRGHSLTFANDGLEALELYKSQDFDVILMDIQMPKMSGDQVTSSIRALEQGTDKHVPIIACTAHAMPGDNELYIESGMDAYLSKPIKGKELIQTVETFGYLKKELL